MVNKSFSVFMIIYIQEIECWYIWCKVLNSYGELYLSYTTMQMKDKDYLKQSLTLCGLLGGVQTDQYMPL